MTTEVETHVSRVTLVGDRAFKRKKPVRMPFLDFRDLAARRAACEAEVALNRRLAPSTYLGVRAVVPDGDGVRLADADAPGAVDYAVEMRRYDERETLAARLAAGTAGAGEVEAVARRVAAFHAQAEPVGVEDAGARVMDALADTCATLLSLHADPARIAALQRAAVARLARRWTELADRAAAGLVRDGHGDLRAEHVVLAPELEVVDCVEFSDDLRVGDVGLDVAFLVMDLVRAGRPDLAEAFVAAYRAAGGDPGDDGLVALFALSRALVRAKVALLRREQVGDAERPALLAQADRLLAVAERLAWRARGPVAVAVCGPPASGKSTLARALAAASGFTLVGSDPIRKALAGLAPGERGGPALYDDEHDRRTYAALLDAAFGDGGSVVLDATFRAEARRADAVRAAREAGLPLLVVECRLPEGELLHRARLRERRGGSASDAGVDVARRLAASWTSWLSAPAAAHAVVRTDAPLAQQLTAIADLADRAPAGGA